MTSRFHHVGAILGALLGIFPVLPVLSAVTPAKAQGLPERAVLERVVLVQRHGVRAPTQSPETLDGWSARGWPVWPVGRGALTDKGAQVVALVADGVREHYAARGLLPAQGCAEGAVLVWADGKDERTRRSGQEMAVRLAPGCGVHALSGSPGEHDRLFDSARGACMLEAGAGARALRDALGPGGALGGDAAGEVSKVLAILKPGAPPPPPTTGGFEVRPDGIVISGPLAVAGASGEIFLLEYAQGFPPAEVAWGAASGAAGLAPLLAPRNRLSDLTSSLPYVAVRQGAAMARFMVAMLSLEPRAAAPAVGAAAKLIALAGHDDNLSNMAGVFGVDWTLPGQPDDTAPATAFALERWRDPKTGEVLVALTLFYAELDGMRDLDPKAVHALPVALPGCEAGTCPLEQVTAQVLAHVPQGCSE